MTSRGIGVAALAVLFASGCHRSYLSAGLHGEFDLSGSFIVVAQPLANGCSEVATDQVESRLDVQHSQGELRLTIVFEGDPYTAQVKRNGQFASDPVRRARGATAETVTMRGRFGDSTISASLDVKRDPVRPVLPTSRSYMTPGCRYHVNVKGTRIAEARR